MNKFANVFIFFFAVVVGLLPSEEARCDFWDEQATIEMIEVNSDTLWTIIENSDYKDLLFNREFWEVLAAVSLDYIFAHQEQFNSAIQKMISSKIMVSNNSQMKFDDVKYVVDEPSYLQFEGQGVDNPLGDNTNPAKLSPTIRYAQTDKKAVISFDRIFYNSECKYYDGGAAEVNSFVDSVISFSNSVDYTPVDPLSVDGALVSFSLDLESALQNSSIQGASAYKFSTSRLVSYVKSYLLPQQKPGNVLEESTYLIHRVLSNGSKAGVRVKWLHNGALRDNWYKYADPNRKVPEIYPFNGLVPSTWSGSQTKATGPFPGAGGTRKYVIDDLSDLPANVYLNGYEITVYQTSCPVSNKSEHLLAFVPFDENRDKKPDFFIPKFAAILPAILHVLL